MHQDTRLIPKAGHLAGLARTLSGGVRVRQWQSKPRVAAQAVIAALSRRSLYARRGLADHRRAFLGDVEEATAKMHDLEALATDGWASAEAAVGDANEALAIIEDYRELVGEAMQVIRDHPRQRTTSKGRALSKLQSERASNPRQRTAELRKMRASFLRADLAAWYGSTTHRRLLEAKAKALGVSTKT